METTGEGPQAPETQEPEIMKSLTLGIVGDLGRLFKEHGLGEQPIQIVEALVFGMFVVTEAFVSVKKGLEQAQESLDLFHEIMAEYLLSEYFFKDQKAQDMEEVTARFNQLREVINQRYQEYRQNFLEDYHDRPLSFRRTLTSLTDHLLAEPLPEGEAQDRLIAVFSVKLAQFWSGCMSSFQPESA